MYVVYDPYRNGYHLDSVERFFDPNYGIEKTFYKVTQNVQCAKRWKRHLHNAIEWARLRNISRSVPVGNQPDHKYQNLPHCEVHEIDDNCQHVATYDAPPIYLQIKSLAPYDEDEVYADGTIA